MDAISHLPIRGDRNEGLMDYRSLPLNGVRIVDFSWYAAAPFATRVLANHGAEVIVIESATRLAAMRQTEPVKEGKEGVNVSGYFNNINTSKLAITLNMSHLKARQIAKRLIQVSDVVVDNFTPKVMRGWGLTYDQLVRIKPDIIVVNVPMQGLTGPRQDYVGLGVAIQAAAGINHLTGFPGRVPIGTGTNYPDLSSNPYHTALAILGALRYRQRTGRGQHIEISQLESTVCLLEAAILDYTVNKRVQTCQGNRLFHAAPHGAYRCKGEDRWCVISVFTNEEWTAFCKAVGNPAWALEEKFDTVLDRKQNEDELDHLVQEWTVERPPEKVMTLLQQAGVTAGVVQNAEDMLTRDPQLSSRGYYVRLDHPEAGKIVCDGSSLRLSRTPGKPRSPAPLLGQHNDYVYKEILGMSEKEINQYYVEGFFD